MENLFRIHHVSEIVDFNHIVPVERIDDALNPLYEVWLEKNWIVVGRIQAVIGPPLFYLVMDHPTVLSC